MFKWLAFRRSGLEAEPGRFDPTSLADPIATKTEWRPMRPGGSSWTTYRLTEVDSTRVEFRATGVVWAVCVVLLGVGVLAIRSAFSVMPLIDGALIELGIGIGCLVVGSAALYSSTAPIVFDKRRNALWKVRVAPYERPSRQRLRQPTRLDRIHAVQIVSEYCRDEDSAFYSHELNLVLSDGARVNLVDHEALEAVRDDARRLGLFLGVPVWDTTR